MKLAFSSAEYQSMIGIHFPELRGCSFCYFDEGDDFIVFIANGQLLFRFPKSELASNRIAIESRLLEKVASFMHAPRIPKPRQFVSSTANEFGFAYMSYEIIPGVPLGKSVKNDNLSAIYNDLGKFLVKLHAFPTNVAAQLGVRQKTFTDDMWNEGQTWRQSLAFVAQEFVKAGSRNAQSILLAIASKFADYSLDTRNHDYSPVLIHNDLTEKNILLDESTVRLAGVIDFGDCAIGDPAHDLLDWPEEVYAAYSSTCIQDELKRRGALCADLRKCRRLFWGLMYKNEQIIMEETSKLESCAWSNAWNK